MKQAFSLNNVSIMGTVFLSTAQVYNNSCEIEAGLAYEMHKLCYSRIANPSNYFLEETAALLETYDSDIEASCVATASGMAVIRTATDPFLIKDNSLPAPNIVSCAKVYGGTFQQFWVQRSEEQGIEVRWIKNPFDLKEWESKSDKGTRFLYGKFPSNPSVTIFDIEMIAEVAHSRNIPLIVDSTSASPAFTRLLEFGADIVIQSATKVMGASGTSIAGLLIAKKNIASKVGTDEMRGGFATWAKFWHYRDNEFLLSPMSAILLLNDIRSLRMRIAQISISALKESNIRAISSRTWNRLWIKLNESEND